ncbi:hypothetical protein Tco_0646224 [Tanacetum coccineum]
MAKKTWWLRLGAGVYDSYRLLGDVEGLCDKLSRLGLSMKDVDYPCGTATDVGVAAIVRQPTSKGDNFRRMTESEIKDRRAKGLCLRCGEKYTPGHRCASSTLQVLSVDESDEAKERDLNFKSWNRAHWIVLDKDNSPEKLCAFDFDSETFKLFASPPCEAIDRKWDPHFNSLGVLNGLLYLNLNTFNYQFPDLGDEENRIKNHGIEKVVIRITDNSPDLDWDYVGT